MKNTPRWKEYCSVCKKNHIVTNKPCPSCGVHSTPQPVSDRILKKHSLSHYDCDGCEAYRDHLH